MKALRRCNSCGADKPPSDFNRFGGGGLQYQCRECQRKYNRARRSQPGYVSWENMKQRVASNHGHAKYYADKGVRLYEPWRDYNTFIMDVGPPPTPDSTIERIDVNGNYEPGNVTWTDRKGQARNRTSNRTVTHNGETLCLAEWSERLGGNATLVQTRLSRGWSESDAVTIPPGGRR